MQKISKIILIATLFLSTACVHTHVERTGRMRLGGGQEGVAPVMATVSADFEEVAIVHISVDSLSNDDRLIRHLQRRASLLGCDAITQIKIDTDAASAACIKRTESTFVAQAQEGKVVSQASPELLTKLVRSGSEGAGLAQMLAGMNNRSAQERAWSINWFLKNYPDSPFRSDIQGLISAPTEAVASLPASTVRAAPSLD